MDPLREMREQDARLQAFKRQAEQDAEEAKRNQSESAKDEARRHYEGDIARASARYSIALGEQYEVRDPYGSLWRAAMQEYAMFHRRQEQMREELAKERDPGKRREIELKREIEGHEYMAITSERLSGMSAVIAGSENAPQAVLDRERAAADQERARELREERSRLIEEREKQERSNGAEPSHSAGQPARPAEATKTNDNKREETEAAARVGGRKEGETEMTDAKQMKISKSQEIEAAYAKRDMQKPTGLDRGGGGRGGR